MKLVKQILVIAILIIAMFSMGFIAYATDAEEKGLTEERAAWLKENLANVQYSTGSIIGTEAWIKNYLTIEPDKAAKDNGDPIYLGTWDIGGESGEIYLKKGKTLEQLVHQINQSMNNNVIDKVEQVTGQLGTKADLDAAIAMMEGFTPIIDLGIGILVTLITLGMTIFSALDICYIAFPIVRNGFEDVKEKGGPGTTTQANGERKLLWITDDAQYAVKKSFTDEGTSPWVIYFKKRVMSYIMLSIILFILMTGNISLITGIALNIVSGIMNVLSGLA